MLQTSTRSTLFPYTTLFRSETVETELLYADLEQAERRLERVSRQAKSHERAIVAEEGWLREVVEGLRAGRPVRSEEHTSELQSHSDLVCRLLLEKKKTTVTE